MSQPITAIILTQTGQFLVFQPITVTPCYTDCRGTLRLSIDQRLIIQYQGFTWTARKADWNIVFHSLERQIKGFSTNSDFTQHVIQDFNFISYSKIAVVMKRSQWEIIRPGRRRFDTQCARSSIFHGVPRSRHCSRVACPTGQSLQCCKWTESGCCSSKHLRKLSRSRRPLM